MFFPKAIKIDNTWDKENIKLSCDQKKIWQKLVIIYLLRYHLYLFVLVNVWHAHEHPS